MAIIDEFDGLAQGPGESDEEVLIRRIKFFGLEPLPVEDKREWSIEGMVRAGMKIHQDYVNKHLEGVDRSDHAGRHLDKTWEPRVSSSSPCDKKDMLGDTVPFSSGPALPLYNRLNVDGRYREMSGSAAQGQRDQIKELFGSFSEQERESFENPSVFKPKDFYTQDELMAFGEYLLSNERVKLLAERYKKNSTGMHVGQRYTKVFIQDIEDWKESKKTK